MSPGLTALRLAWRGRGLRGLVAIAAGAWLLMLLGSAAAGAGACSGGHHHHAAAADFHCASFQLSEWLLMVAAMMAPLLAPMVDHVWRSSLPRRRFDALLALAAGYGLCWGAAGLLLMPLAGAIGQSWTAALTLGAMALAWSCSPFAQRARNRCHRLRGINPFGLSADRDSFIQGITAGVPCLFACWPWMLVPMSVPAGHAGLTLAITAWLFLERLAGPQPLAWRAPPALATLRLLAPLTG